MATAAQTSPTMRRIPSVHEDGDIDAPTTRQREASTLVANAGNVVTGVLAGKLEPQLISQIAQLVTGLVAQAELAPAPGGTRQSAAWVLVAVLALSLAGMFGYQMDARVTKMEADLDVQAQYLILVGTEQRRTNSDLDRMLRRVAAAVHAETADIPPPKEVEPPPAMLMRGARAEDTFGKLVAH